MTDDFSHLSGDEKRKAENEFLKMKLMLEHGATFSEDLSGENKKLPDEIENEFLKNVAAFEEHMASPKTVKVFDKIGRPAHFKPVAEIPEDEMETAYGLLLEHLHNYNLHLDVCSPNISTRELYRFVTEELFEHETDDMNLPGWTTNYIYDEFHPDPVYDNTRTAVNYCVRQIFQKDPLDWTHYLKKEGTNLNQHDGLSRKEFKERVSRFQNAYDALKLSKSKDAHCTLHEGICTVTGTYRLSATLQKEAIRLKGKWKVVTERDGTWNDWYITPVVIEGIAF